MNTSIMPGNTTFSRVNATDLKLFRVNAGVPVEDALEMASLLQHYANELNLDAALSDKGERVSWPAPYLGQMAKALIDDISDAMYLSRADE